MNTFVSSLFIIHQHNHQNEGEIMAVNGGGITIICWLLGWAWHWLGPPKKTKKEDEGGKKERKQNDGRKNIQQQYGMYDR